MLEAYSLNQTVASMDAVPFTSVSLKKGCTAELSGASTIQLNKCGVYMVSFDASSTTATTVELYKNGIEQPQAQSTGLNPSFVTLVQVTENNSCCPCSAPTTLQVINVDDAEATLTDADIAITKLI